MGSPALDERGALLDAEAMLLVDDRNREVAQLEALRDERMGADDDVRVGCRPRLHRARDEGAAHAELRADALD
ncbi:MAG TPA: hypothetical protein VNT23_10415, partial [Gaiellaceae bacterium]|nr:hypothetical protein [Gaiellaceae bacterium]